jgi:DNA-binding FadR family transcriptional regulator
VRLPPRAGMAADAVRGMIAAGELQPGARAPTGRALAEATGISLTYCRLALRALEDGGTLRAQGRGRPVAGAPGAV